MSLKWLSLTGVRALEEPQIVLAAPGSVSGRQRLTQVLAAGSLLAVAARPAQAVLPRPTATHYTVINLNGTGSGSLRAALDNANTNPGFDTITFQAGLVGVIPLTTELSISDSVQIIGPGPGALAVSGGNLTRVFYLYASAPFTTTISGLTIRDGAAPLDSGAGISVRGQPLTLDNVRVLSNTASGDGGGIAISPKGGSHAGLTLRNSVVSGNHANKGGGIYISSAPDGILIQNSQILTNTAALSGGGAKFYYVTGTVTIEDSNIAGNSALYGAGVYVLDGGDITIRRTTISSNTANFGGGLSLYDMTKPFLLENSTISGNHADSDGGGIYVNASSQPISIRSSTIVSNTADEWGGGIADDASAALPITNTIIASNLAPLGGDITGTFQLKYDLVQVTGTATISDAGGNLFGLDPLLGPLANNGGPTQTHLPLHGSPAIDTGDPAFAAPPNTDQRGDPRKVNGRIDIGAVETALKLFLPLVQR